MKTIIKPVYYCDFCHKRGLSKPMMSRHEKSCTKNPNRQCRMCDTGRDLPTLIDKFKKQLILKESRQHLEDVGEWVTIEAVEWPKIEDIEESVDCCPACVMTILKQAGLTWYYVKDKIPYNFIEAKKEWWDNINAEKLRRGE